MADGFDSPTVLIASSADQFELYRSVIGDSAELVRVDSVQSGLDVYTSNRGNIGVVLLNSCFGQGGDGHKLADGLREAGFRGRMIVRSCRVDCISMLGIEGATLVTEHRDAARTVKKCLRCLAAFAN